MRSKKEIQVKRTINPTNAKESLKEFIEYYINNDDRQMELWFAEYVLANKMDLIYKLELR